MITKSNPIPARAGIGLRAQHYQEIVSTVPDVGWFEVHSENYFGAGGKPLYYLQMISERYPISLHGVGLSIGSCDPLNKDHLNKLKNLIQRFNPGLVSEHLSWGSLNGRYVNDLLPIPYTHEALQHMINRVAEIQDYLQRQILIENVSSYLEFNCSDINEWEFLTELASQSGCGILLDINNVYVNSRNHGINAIDYIEAVPIDYVQEIHLAGHTVKQFDDGEILIDTHNQRICQEVWSLYQTAAYRFQAVPVLIEWDADIPELKVLLDEAMKADRILQNSLGKCNYEYIA